MSYAKLGMAALAGAAAYGLGRRALPYSDMVSGNFATFDDFKKEVRRTRLRNKNNWWSARATVEGREVEIRAFGHSLASGRYTVDGLRWTPGYGDESVRHFNESLAKPFARGRRARREFFDYDPLSKRVEWYGDGEPFSIPAPREVINHHRSAATYEERKG